MLLRYLYSLNVIVSIPEGDLSLVAIEYKCVVSIRRIVACVYHIV